MFDAADERDEESVEIGDVLDVLNACGRAGRRSRPKKFTAADVFAKLGDGRYPTPEQTTLRQFFTLGGTRPCSSLYVGRGLKSILDKPLLRGGGEDENKKPIQLVRMTLRARSVSRVNRYWVERRDIAR